MTSQPRRVGRYEILREIGRGGMAAVYLAHQVDLSREIALKQLAGLHASDPESVARFLYESQVTGRLAHPNIVTVHEFFEHEGIPYIAMEYLPNGSLRPLVGGLGLAQIAAVLEGVLAALQHASECGVVHRDLKPENLMVTGAGGVKVADFGIAKALNEVSTGFATATGMPIGTPAYMSPEQAMARPVGPATDLYAVGVIAHELLVGRVPFESSESPIAVLFLHAHEPLPPPLSVDPTLDPELAAWLEWMLAKEPPNRPASAEEAWEGLEEIVIRLLGPRWRRDARLEPGGAEGGRRRTPTPSAGPTRASTGAPRVPTPPPTPPPAPRPTPPGTPSPPSRPTIAEPAGASARSAERPAPSRSPRRGRFIGVGAAVLAALALGGTALALLLPGADDAPASAEGATTTATTGTTGTTGTTPVAGSLTLAEYRREANAVCEGLPIVSDLFSAVETPAQLRSVVTLALSSSVRPAIAQFDALEPPPEAAEGHRDILRFANREARVLERLGADLDAGRDPAAASEEAATALDALAAQADVRFRQLELNECREAPPTPSS